MEYYNHRGELVTYNEEDNTKVIESRTANLYFYEYYIYKKYHSYSEAENRIVLDVFETLSHIDNRHLMQITELLINTDKYKGNYFIKECFTNNLIDAYTMPIIKEDEIDLFNVSVEYLCEMINELQELFKIFSELHIEVKDLVSSNVLLQENNMVLIDWDRYRKTQNDENFILYENLTRLVSVFCIMYFEKCNGLEEQIKISRLFPMDININNSLSLRLKQNLKGCKTISEYLHKY